MTTMRTDSEYVVFLAGRALAVGSQTVPDGALAIWCREPDEVEDRARRLKPRCAILDATGRNDLVSLAHATRAAVGAEAIVGVLGAPSDVPPNVDCVLEGPTDVARTVRFALGLRVRSAMRASCDCRGQIELDDGRSIEVRVVDLSEEGVRVSACPGLPESGSVVIHLSLPTAPDLTVRARALRSAGSNGSASVVFRFIEVDARARAALRAFLLRRLARNGAATAGLVAPTPPPRARSTVCIVGRSLVLRRALETIDRVAPTDVTVLLLGETGTGKELAARTLHEGSPRASQPFVAVNCAALPENLVESELFGHEPGAFTGAAKRKIGRIEQASGGTLFLDEIGDLPAGAQAKLLRALQERVIERVGGNEAIRVDIRLIAATNQNLAAGMAQRSFRRDLFFRLNVVAITLPPLRDRQEDIPLLVDHFLRRSMERMGKKEIRLNEHAAQTLLRYPWPGSVRELENLCTRLVALAPSGAVLGPEHLNLFIAEDLADSPLPSTDLRDILDFCEREIVKRMLDRHGGNRTKTARSLGISRQALQQKLARYRGAGVSGGDADDAA